MMMGVGSGGNDGVGGDDDGGMGREGDGGVGRNDGGSRGSWASGTGQGGWLEERMGSK